MKRAVAIVIKDSNLFLFSVSARKIEPVPQKKEVARKLSLKETPMESTEFLHDFLLLHSTLEQIKDDWACRKLGVLSIKTTKLHRAFL